MSNNDNFRHNYGDWPLQNTYQYTNYDQGQRSTPTFNPKDNYQTFSSNDRQYHDNYTPTYKPYQFDLKQRGRSNTSTSLSSGLHTESMPSLNSFARSVNQTVLPQDKYETSKFSNTDGFANQFQKYSGRPPKDARLASSAIFQPTLNEEQFNRFPSFNLGLNQANKNGLQSGPSQSFSHSSSNQTPKEKRQRQIAQIKKRLEAINKKANKPTDNFFDPGQSRPSRAVSQSVIFDNSSYSNEFRLSGFGQKPTLQNPSNSIEQMYSLKKNKDVQKSNNESNYQTYPYSQQTVSAASYQAPKYQSQPVSKNLQSYTKYETNSKYPPQQNYEYKPQNYNKFEYSSFNYDKPTIPKEQTKATETAYNTHNTYNTSSYNNYSTPSYNPVQTPTSSTSTYNFNQPTQDPAMGFKKKKAFQASIEAGLQSGKLPSLPSISPVIVTKPVQKQSPSKIRRIDSVSYEDFSQPIQQLKKIKLSDFEMGKKMGKGQFGEVMLVRHKITGWVCGLKVMEKKQIKDQDYAGQIARQLSIQFYLMHRYIAQLYGYFQDEKNFYLLVEFCTGGQLLERLRKQKKMNQKDVSLIIRQVCQGVDYIHKQYIIHRDLKPQNILFNFNNVKISDFGWAVYRGFGMRKTASGSPLYYPPQIVKGEEYDDKIDVWNIGMMTYQCILGKIPFRVYSQLDLGKIVSDEITFPSYVDVTDEAKDFILKTMKKKGQQRIQIREMLRHPFIKKYQDTQISPSILEEFRKVVG